MHQLDMALPDDAIVVGDMTIQAYWGVLYLDARRPGGFCYPMSGALDRASRPPWERPPLTRAARPSF